MISYLGGYSFFRSYLVIFFVCVIYSGFVSADYRNNYCNSGAELGSNSISLSSDTYALSLRWKLEVFSEPQRWWVP